MDRSWQLLSSALLRPINLVAPGAGLLLALTEAPWWIFPVSLVPYSIMVALNLRDPKFVARTIHAEDKDAAGDAIPWRAIAEELGRGEWLAPLERIAASERKLSAEVDAAPEGARAVIASTLAQVRDVARLAIDLARKLKGLDAALTSYAAMNPARAKQEAAERRRRAASATDDQARASFLEAARSLEESATAAESLVRLRERTVAQLDNVAASIENVAVRSIRVRVSSDGTNEVADALRVDIDAIRETLGVFEETDIEEAGVVGAKGRR